VLRPTRSSAIILRKRDAKTKIRNTVVNLCWTSVVTVVVTPTRLPTTTLPVVCPSAYELSVYQYSTRDYFTIEYPVDGYQVLKGSDDVLTIPPNGDQEIRLTSENVVFMELRFSVRYAKSATLLLTQSDLQKTTVRHPAAVNAVS